MSETFQICFKTFFRAITITARTEDRTELCIAYLIYKLPRDYIYRGFK